METYGVQYFGSKSKLVDTIATLADNLGAKTAIDIFTGTTRVAQGFRQKGIKTTTVDLSSASKAYSAGMIQQNNMSHLQPYIDEMNKMKGVSGWLTKNYSGGQNYSTTSGDGRYLHPKNAMKADQARDYIDTLTLSDVDKNTLVCSVIFACNRVNNSVANQQAYLKEWCDRSLQNIRFELPPRINGPVGAHIEGDCFNVTYPEADLAYMDPPYTPTVLYHNYYHIWDSIMIWDKPNTDLKSKRRIDRVKPKKSKANPNYNTSLDNNDWYKNAAQAFNNIMQKLQHVKHVMISYSSESIVSKDDLEKILLQYGIVKIYELDHNRMIMGSIGYSSKSNKVVKTQGKLKEYIFVVSK